MVIKAQGRPKAAKVKTASGPSVEARLATLDAAVLALQVAVSALGAARSQSSVTRSLNTAFQVSTTRDALVIYTPRLTVTASIAGGQDGDVFLEIADNNTFTVGVQQVSISGLGQTYTLAVAIQGVQPQSGVVVGYVPAGKWVRLRTANNTGTPATAYRVGQEILL